jgi:quercetin dioxygenase-like cupin family protein
MQFDTRLPFREALRRIPAEGLPSVPLFEDAALTVELYTPYEVDRQPPHGRDEIYIVARGDGDFVVSGKRHPCSPNDLLYVPAHVPHRFENISADFAVWVLFFGPEKKQG